MILAIDRVIADFENRPGRLWPHEVAEALHSAGAGGGLNEVEQRALDIEIAAWNLRLVRGRLSPWGTHFHPHMVGNGADGSPSYHPSLDALGAEAVAQWSERLSRVTNPAMKARYADLLWDLGHILQGGTARDYKAGLQAVDAYVAQASHLETISAIEAATALERAFLISLELNDSKRRELVADQLLALAAKAPLDLIGVWAMPAICLLESRGTPRHCLDQLTAQLERRAAEAESATNGHACETAARYLRKMYRDVRNRENKTRVLRTLARTWEQAALGASAGVAIGWLSSVVELLESEGLNEDADRLRLTIEKRGLEALGDMHTVSVESSFDRKEVDESIDEILDVQHPFLALFRLAYNLSPRCNALRLQVKQNEQSFAFYSLIPRTIIGSDGLPKATIGSSDTDMDGRMVEEAMQSFMLTPHFFHLGYVKAKKRFSFDHADLARIASASYLCSAEIAKPLGEGIEAYDVEDYTKTISVLIPQIEAMLRGLLKMLDAPTRKGNRRKPGFSELKNMNDVLADLRVEESIEEDLLFFLRVVFVDKRGWNLRNEFAHGALPAEAYNVGTASVVIMALLLLAMIGPHGAYLSSDSIHGGPV